MTNIYNTPDVAGDNAPVSTNFPGSIECPFLRTLEPISDKPVGCRLVMASAPNSAREISSSMDFSLRFDAGMRTLKHFDTILCHLPSILAAGCIFLLFPHYIDFLLFHTGYLSAQRGVERLGALASVSGVVPIFLCTSAWLVGFYLRTVLGLTISCALLSRFLYAWWDFRFTQNIPLGEDDRQSIFRIFVKQELGITGDTVVRQPNGSLVRMGSSAAHTIENSPWPT